MIASLNCKLKLSDVSPRTHKIASAEKTIKSRFPEWNKANVWALAYYLTKNKLREKNELTQTHLFPTF